MRDIALEPAMEARVDAAVAVICRDIGVPPPKARSSYLTDHEASGFTITVADNIRRLREARRLSREGLARLAGLTSRQVAYAEEGVHSHSFFIIAKLAAALRLTTAAFTVTP